MKFREVSVETERKLRYIGYCTNCSKETSHRFLGGNLYKSRYRCITCKTINEVDDKG